MTSVENDFPTRIYQHGEGLVNTVGGAELQSHNRSDAATSALRTCHSLNRTVSGDTFPTLSSLDKPILHESFNMHKICAEMVPKLPSKKESRMNICTDILNNIDTDSGLLHTYVTNYQSKLCPFKRHMFVQQDASSIRSYDCSFCSYKAKRKYHLTRHMLTHQDASEAMTYQCALCSYKAKRKRHLNTHMLIHKNASEETTYDCSFCSYKTKHKYHLTKHMLTHQDASEDTKSAQNQEQNIMEYQESERCLAIKSEELDIKEEKDECGG
ncbi:hypothetical protein NQ318_012546 [Aromia moschata]|uniref:C2H2-type domain-containing protein n=1 Tax=Aromia moschata TaxID=1265417 RepID=A0AAV8XAB3_9CUCU|nr:hypothetical protein NQ318_012546 [Aromia moschata]